MLIEGVSSLSTYISTLSSYVLRPNRPYQQGNYRPLDFNYIIVVRRIIVKVSLTVLEHRRNL
jgi:hypothetical protein